ncbi:MAG: dienelactone hydrolase family protein [Phycisphaerales bacterium]|nr:MAG: dienelactone hydrolase family protein [Phycisphaerales bacterium]
MAMMIGACRAWAGVLLAVAAALWSGVGSAFGADIVQEEIRYEHDGLELTGVVFYDRSRTGRLPGVLVVHEWWGLNRFAKERAEALAELGYLAFACDMYGIDEPVTTPDEAQALAMPLYQDPELFRGRAAAGLEALRRHPRADMTKTAAIGYCFGGAAVLELARSGTDLAAVVSFHGSLSTTMPAEPGQVRARVLVCNGAADPLVPMRDRQSFIEEMESANADYQFVEFGRAVHSFTNRDAGEVGIPGVAYHERSDRRSWALMRHWLEDAFDGR